MKDAITLVLLGDIAAGKGTQAKILARRFGLALVDTGAYSRRVLTGSGKISRRLTRIKLGKLAPSDIIQNYLKAELLKFGSRKSVLLDGGKMPAEARLIYKIFKSQRRRILVIYLHIPHAEIFRRLKYRYYCARTGEPLVVKSGAKKCPRCGGRIIKRADDDPAALRNRIDYYDKIYSKTVKFWRGKKLLRTVNGRRSISAVTREISKVIEDHYGAH